MSKTGNVFSRYIQQFDWSKIADDLFSKLVSLLLLFILFYIVKKILHLSVTKIIAPSLKLSKQDVARQKTITRLIENLLNYVLYFLLIYWVLSILGLPVSSLLAGAGIAGVAIGMGALHFVPNRNIMVVSNLSRGDMRVLIDIPLYAQTDLDEIYRIISKVNEEAVPEHPEILKEPDVLGPQMASNGQFNFRISMIVQGGMQVSIYHIFYRLYHEALLREGIELPTLGPLSKGK